MSELIKGYSAVVELLPQLFSKKSSKPEDQTLLFIQMMQLKVHKHTHTLHARGLLQVESWTHNNEIVLFLLFIKKKKIQVQ